MAGFSRSPWYKSTHFYNKQHGNVGISPEEMEALNSLKKDKSIIICKADKGNAVVLLNKLDYINKMNCVLSDTKRFKQVNYDNNIHKLDKFQKCLYYLNRKGSLEQEIYDRIRPSAAVTPTLYGLPKIHKENCPCRPVLASTDCYTYKCASWLSEILSPLRQHPTNLKDIFEFVDRMQQVKFKNNSVMVSFDVKSLFTNIPVDFVTDIILKEIYGSDSTKKYYGLTKRQFKNLLVWTTKRTNLNFNGSFYEQIDGVGMGSPIAPAFADIFMNYVIEKTKEFNMQPDVFFRYVDDCFAVFPDFESAMMFYGKLNQIHSNVNFTYELENNKQLPFLDVNVDNSKDKLELSIYRKPTHSGLYNKWSSLAPTKYKINLIRSLVNRAIKVCSNRQLLFLECEKITKMLQQNEYPTKTIRNVIRKAINRNQKPDAKLYPNQQQSTKHCVFFKLKSLVLKVTKSHFAEIEISPTMHFTWFSEHVRSRFFLLKCAEVYMLDLAISIVDANLVLKVLKSNCFDEEVTKSKQLISAHAQCACLHSAVRANNELVTSRLVPVESGYLTVYKYDYEVNKVPDAGFE